MRDLILKRLNEIKEKEKGFPKDTIRWRDFIHNDVHVSELDFNTFNDVDLLRSFEYIFRRSRKIKKFARK